MRERRENVILDWSNPVFTERIPDASEYWSGTDGKEWFEENLSKKPNDESLRYYVGNPIHYKKNTNFFRTPDNFDTQERGNIFLGCSHTFGTGHHLENVWSYKLSKYLGGKFFNLAQGGAGFMYQYRVLMHWVDKLNVDNVFLYQQESPRWDLYGENLGRKMWTQAGIWGPIPESDLAYRLITSEESNFVMQEGMLSAIHHECKKRGIDFYFESCTPPFSGRSLQARDLQHWSVGHQHELFKIFRNKLHAKKTWE